ncbi:MAG: neutral/alkaline non-lysosomal ceramidase N-terminal domain-containing protein [Verrucomicrobiae bacterium]|nr:neutral/alkaline non-lysosomal ceramidase N-terminal domain-containing protein [Verrucomicrobiae bacterium]
MTGIWSKAASAAISAAVSLCAVGTSISLVASDTPELNGLTVHNKGIGGQNTVQGRARFERDVVVLRPGFVFIYFGLNDALNESKFVPLEKFIANLAWMVERARAAGIQPVLCTIHRVIEEPLLKRHKREAYGNEGPNGKIASYNAAIRQLARQKNVPLADFAGAVAASRDHPGASIIRPDGVHLGPDGNRLLARCFLDAVGGQLTGKENIVCFGDSVTYGAGSNSAATAEGDTYPTFLRQIQIRTRQARPPSTAAAWKAGIARTVITPEKPVWLAGYGSKRVPEGKLHDLWLKALALEDATGRRAVLVTSDFQGIPKAMADRTCEKLRHRFGLARDQVMLTYSHNHCGPRLTGDLYDYYPVDAEQEALVDEYTAQMEAKIVETVGAALSKLAPANLRIGEGRATFAVNRRNNREAEIPDLLAKHKPLKGPVDHAVPVMTVTGANGQLLGILFGYACHPTTLSFTQWCGDYPGFAQLALEKNHPGATATFINTCGGDQNPLPRRRVELCERYGRMLAEGVETGLKQPMKPVSPVLRTAFEFVELPYERVVTREELQAELQNKNAIRARWAARMLKKLDAGEKFALSYPYPIHAWRLGKELLLIGMGGETVVDYALRFKKEFGPGTWVCGYADDLVAYIPSRRVWEEGGYEGGSFLYEYGRPAFRWAGDVEERIGEAVQRLVNRTKEQQ